MQPIKILINFWLLLNVFASFAQAPKYSNDFLNIGIGAKALAIGGATVASPCEIESGYWNPALLPNLSAERVLGGMFASYFANVARLDHIGFASKIDQKSAFSINYIRFGVDNIPNTINLFDPNGQIDYNRITGFSSTDNALFLSYGRQINDKGWHLGGSAKIIRRIAGEFASSWGYGIDLGVFKKGEHFSFGANLRDITTTYNSWKYNLEQYKTILQSTGNQVPISSIEITKPTCQFGMAYQSKINKNIDLQYNIDFMAALEQRNTLINTNGFSLDPRTGLKITIKDLFYIMGGIASFQRENDINGKTNLMAQPNLGIGFSYKTVQLDYALTNAGSGARNFYSNFISLKLRFKPTSNS